jgi:hypothetical protein
MEYNHSLENKVVNKFFIKEKRERIKAFLGNPKRRRDFTFSLAHCQDLRFEKFNKVTGRNEAMQISKYVSKLEKINTCYIISENENIDGKVLKITEALNETIGRGDGTLLVFGDAEILFFEGESAKDRWISNY